MSEKINEYTYKLTKLTKALSIKGQIKGRDNN